MATKPRREPPPPSGHPAWDPDPCAQDGRRAQADTASVLLLCRRRLAARAPSCRGRWKFLWIRPGAEARWAVCVGSARPPHPVPHPLRPPSPPGFHSCASPPPGPSTAASPPSRLWPGPGGSHPSPSLEEPVEWGGGLGGRGGDQEGLLPGNLSPTGATLTSSSSSGKWEPLGGLDTVHGARLGAWHPETPRHRPCRGSCSRE